MPSTRKNWNHNNKSRYLICYVTTCSNGSLQHACTQTTRWSCSVSKVFTFCEEKALYNRADLNQSTLNTKIHTELCAIFTYSNLVNVVFGKKWLLAP